MLFTQIGRVEDASRLSPPAYNQPLPGAQPLTDDGQESWQVGPEALLTTPA